MFDNLHISDGGIGSGNAVFQCGIDESDPTAFVRGGGVPSPTLASAAIASLVFTDSRLDGTQTFSGATNPDVALRLANSCRSSVYRALSAYDGTKADILEYNGNLLNQMHVNSDAANSSAGLANPSLALPVNTVFAGVADYGVYVIGATALSQTQCDIANMACVRLFGGGASAGQITDTQMKCGTLQSVSPSYLGISLAAAVVNTTVSGTAASSQCHVPASQLVAADGAIDPTVSLCNNSNALLVYCAGNRNQSGFAAGRYYTQPSLAYSTVSLIGAVSGPTTLYAIPYINPTGGVITQMGMQVTTAGVSGTQCDLGIYSSVAGAPGALLLDSSTINANTIGMKINAGLNFTLQPNTLYFLAVGCNGAVTVEGTNNTSGPISLLLGEPDFTSFGDLAVGNATSLSTTWASYVAHGLPATFGAPAYGAVGTTLGITPNIYLGP